MAYREGNRNQLMMFPPSFDEMIDENDPVRMYEEFVENLDVEALGLKLNNNKEGNPEYHPKSMLKGEATIAPNHPFVVVAPNGLIFRIDRVNGIEQTQ